MDKYLRSALTQAAAEARRQLFKDSKDNLAYHLFLKMKKGLTYEGSVRIEFDLQKVSSDFFIDYAGTTIKQFTINGTKIDTQDSYESLRNLRFLRFPQENLKADKNEAVILFENVYSTDRVGLHSFVDIDGLQYTYSQGEAYGMNKIFPCFDQPDLKAPLSVVIGTPNDWIAVANQPACSETASKLKVDEYLSADEQKDYHLTAFKTTPRLSTYLYAFGGGAYDEIICPNPHKAIQMACYCRKTLTKYLQKQSEEIFEITRETLNFYETYFDYPYAFEKYDYLFFPETYFGGMENPGLVVIADSLIWKEEVTAERTTRRASLLTHEAAHLWFGDLVTCKWWNDIWLNESFAEFISFFCLDAIKDRVSPKFSNIWAVFFKKKGWGYEADQRRTTHPIAGQVSNTDHAETVFDGITYSKGAATIKQLIHLIGKDKFGKAMSSYFRKYEWSNATLHDFIASLQEYYQPQFKESPKSLDEWKAEFLDTAGLNECSPIFRPEQTDSKSELVIRQTVALSYHPTLRHHKMKIAFFNENLEVCEEIDAVLSNTSETKITYDGSKKPKAVLLNYEDETFIKVRLDEHSIALFNEKLHLMKDDLTKTVVWKALFDMVRDGLLSGYKFVEIANKSIPTEPSDLVLNFIFNYVQDILNLSPHFLADNVLKPSLFETTLQALTKSDKVDKNRLILLKENLILLASYGKEKNVDNIQFLQKWLDGQEERLKHIELGTQNKWDIVVKLHRYTKLNEEERKKYFDKVANTDSSNTVKLKESKCEALNANPEQREKLWKSYHNPDNKLSLDILEASMSGYNNSLRNEGEAYEKLFFDNVVDVFKKRGNEFAQSFYNLMFPHGENLKYYTEQIEHLLKQDIDNDWLVLSLKESLDNLEVKKKVYTCYGNDIMRLFFDIKI